MTGWPPIAAKADSRRFRKGPYTKVLASLELLTEQKVAPLPPLQGQLERAAEETLTLRSATGDYSDAADETNPHSSLPRPKKSLALRTLTESGFSSIRGKEGVDHAPATTSDRD